ncbi:sensor histidine kinase [Fundidesulfovibrio terrae]|uniref:sensor histidine kinase n=1 Tax=Fundidesulfovibrio terrae TaxID=2922866 RepID=UPI001FAEAC94|nr:histidine kinase dimerization/phosphoacceptor domain -containing protein [Fundidesulfovibrio terrae]
MAEHAGAAHSFMGFEPHGHCFLWQPDLIALHTVSDLVTGLSYYIIPVIIFYFVRKRSDVPFPAMLLLFALFIISCGTTHLMSVWTIWTPDYWLEGWVKSATAFFSLLTVLLLFPMIPRALRIPSPAQLEAANRKLETEVDSRRQAEAELKRHKDHLEDLVAERTSELELLNENLKKEIDERKQVETELRTSEERFRVMVEQAPEAVVVSDVKQGKTVDANANAVKLFGCSREELFEKGILRFYLPDQPDGRPVLESTRENSARALAGEEVVLERSIRNLHGQERICEVRLVRLPSSDHDLVRASWIDITERKRTEEIMAASLREKEVLLREIHHRVKNNLNIISSLLSLQEDAVDHPAALDALAESRGRITSMAMIHEQLYTSGDFSGIEVDGYLRQLLARLVAAYRATGDISLAFDLSAITLTLDQAIPFGLIMNELVTNSLKHAFRNRDRGTITVSTALENGSVNLVIADDGEGLPQGFSLNSVSSLGLQIVTMLVRQLHGKLTVEPAGGARFRLCFPLRYQEPEPGLEDAALDG